VVQPPQRLGVCDVDGSPLYQRADDTREVQERRIDVHPHTPAR
jgi:adenylate kinase